MINFLKHIHENILFRLGITLTVFLGAAWLLYTGNWFWGGMAVLMFIFCIWWVTTLYNNQIKKVIFLLDALENNDNALRFTEQEGNKENRMINHLLNRVARILYDAKTETVQQEKYYELILSFMNTGIMILNDKGAVIQKNDELLKLFTLEVFTHIRQLNKVDADLKKKLEFSRPGDKFQVSFHNERGNVTLSVRVSGITIRNENLRIFALNDINNELDEKELDSWVRLTRVLTHEIMNSVTPITSLSDTMLSIAENKDEEIRRGLQTISTTGKGLLSFVESYRRFTRIPTPEPALFYIKPFIERMVELTKHQQICDQVMFDILIRPDDLILYADENLISQVVINLLKNAIEAINKQPGGHIRICSYSNEAEEVLIEISNNGMPIDSEVAEQIFVPFFTTKQGGNGIGLSLSRQIMRVSGGNITLKSDPQSLYTTFILRFK